MTITRLDFRANAVKPPPKSAPALFKSAGLGRVYFPGRGLPHSLVAHVIAFAIVYVFASFPVALPKLPVPPEKIVMIDLNDPMSVMFLPVFDGGRSGADKTERRAKSEQTKPVEPPATTTQGFSYPCKLRMSVLSRGWWNRHRSLSRQSLRRNGRNYQNLNSSRWILQRSSPLHNRRNRRSRQSLRPSRWSLRNLSRCRLSRWQNRWSHQNRNQSPRSPR
jgi:hypothetical protein